MSLSACKAHWCIMVYLVWTQVGDQTKKIESNFTPKFLHGYCYLDEISTNENYYASPNRNKIYSSSCCCCCSFCCCCCCSSNQRHWFKSNQNPKPLSLSLYISQVTSLFNMLSETLPNGSSCLCYCCSGKVVLLLLLYFYYR